MYYYKFITDETTGVYKYCYFYNSKDNTYYRGALVYSTENVLVWDKYYKKLLSGDSITDNAFNIVGLENLSEIRLFTKVRILKVSKANIWSKIYFRRKVIYSSFIQDKRGYVSNILLHDTIPKDTVHIVKIDGFPPYP